MNRWQYQQVPFKFQLSDWTLFSVPLMLQARSVALLDEAPPQRQPAPPLDELIAGSQGFVIRGLPVVEELPRLSRNAGYLCYVPLQYRHCYIDFSMGFGDYQKKFSSKTRSTIARKVRKFAEHCGGRLEWKTYREPAQMQQFLRLARMVSKLTYQERLLDAGIPDSDEFLRELEALAAAQRVRAYLLFDGERPVAYLCCPVQDEGIVVYAHLGYDPAYMHLSVGTVLQWLAVEQLFAEGRFRYFDFTEGHSEHKQLFATHQRQCANVFLVKDTLRNRMVLNSHLMMDSFSKGIGEALDRFGAKKRIKHLLRFAS